jgi:hypothetical protein
MSPCARSRCSFSRATSSSFRRAFAVSGTVTGTARNLIVPGLAGGDNLALAERLVQIERRPLALEAATRKRATAASRLEMTTGDLRAKFDALLQALSSGGEAS